MPAQVFDTDEVSYACAPFKKARLAYNDAAGCLNMLVPNSSRGAIELCRNGPWDVKVEGRKCRINDIVEANFQCEEQAHEFVRCIKEEEDTPAPSTPPMRTEKKEAESTDRLSNRRRRWYAQHDEDVDEFVDNLVKADQVSGSSSVKKCKETSIPDQKPSAPPVDPQIDGGAAPARELRRHHSISERFSPSAFLEARRQLRRVKTEEPEESKNLDRSGEAGDAPSAAFRSPSIADELDVQQSDAANEADARVFGFLRHLPKNKAADSWSSCGFRLLEQMRTKLSRDSQEPTS